MGNMDKRLTVPEWVLIVWPKIPQMPQNFSAQFFCLSPKVLDFNEKRLHWASVTQSPALYSCFFEQLKRITNFGLLKFALIKFSYH